jgi:hypothetical protein
VRFGHDLGVIFGGRCGGRSRSSPWRSSVQSAAASPPRRRRPHDRRSVARPPGPAHPRPPDLTETSTTFRTRRRLTRKFGAIRKSGVRIRRPFFRVAPNFRVDFQWRTGDACYMLKRHGGVGAVADQRDDRRAMPLGLAPALDQGSSREGRTTRPAFDIKPSYASNTATPSAPNRGCAD